MLAAVILELIIRSLYSFGISGSENEIIWLGMAQELLDDLETLARLSVSARCWFAINGVTDSPDQMNSPSRRRFLRWTSFLKASCETD